MKRVIQCSILVFMLLLAAGCGLHEHKEKPKYQLYYINEKETTLVPAPYEPKQEDTKSMVTEVIALLQHPTEEEHHQGLLLQDITIKSQKIAKQRVTIDFSQSYQKMDNTREILVRAGFVKSLIQIPNITEVEFSLEGQPMIDSQGNTYPVMTAETFVENEGKNINTYLGTTLNLYFANQAGDKLVKEQVKVYYSSNVPLEKVIVEQLLKGPRESGHQRTLPAETKILSVAISEGICYVNLNKTFMDTASTAGLNEEIPIYSIVHSIMDACDVTRVQIAVNGETKLTFRENINLDHFFTRNYDLLEEESNE